MKFFKTADLIIIAVLLTIFGITSSGGASDKLENWEETYNYDGIVAYERSFPGEEIKEFKGVAEINAGIEVISAVLKDIPSMPLWAAKCKYTKIYKELENDGFIYYFETKSPWPISSRGIVMQSKTVFNPDTGITEILFKAIKDDENYPVSDDLVQMVDLKGKYIIEFISRNVTRMTYISKADPAGSLSISLAQNESKLYPVTNLEGLRKMVKLKKYIKLGRKSKIYDRVEAVVSSPEIIEKMSRHNINEFVLDPETVNMVLEDKSIVKKIISSKASRKSLKYCVLDSWKKMIVDERIRKVNQDKRLRKIIALDNLFQDKLLGNLILKDSELIGLMVNDSDLMIKILTDKNFLHKLLDSDSLAQTITGDMKLISKMASDKALAKTITQKLPECKTIRDFRGVIKQYVDANKTNS